MIHMDTRPGDHVDDCIVLALQVAAEANRPVVFNFYTVDVVCYPGADPFVLRAQFDLDRAAAEARNIAIYESREGATA